MILHNIKSYILGNQKLSLLASFFYTRVFGLNSIYFNKKNKIKLVRCYLKGSKIKFSGSNNRVVVNDNCKLIKCKFNIYGNNNTIIFDKCSSASNCEIVIENDNNTISIGESTHLCGPIHFACIENTKICIGMRCLFSSKVTLRTGDSHSIINENGDRINWSKSVFIGDHVWIGNNVTITKGVIISDNSIVATGAIVTKEFSENNIILGGIPADIIKKNVNWDLHR